MVGQPYVLMLLSILLMVADSMFVLMLLCMRTNLKEVRFLSIRRMLKHHVSKSMWTQPYVLILFENVSSWFVIVRDIRFQAWGHMRSNHEEKNIWRRDLRHVENAIQTMRRITYGDMVESMWKMPCQVWGEKHMETRCKACGEWHVNHKESSMWRYDSKHVENSIETMWRIAYGNMMTIMWRMPCQAWGEYYMETWCQA